MRKEGIDRINELSHISKERALTEEEQAERAQLRQSYLEDFRKSFRATLDNTVVQTHDGQKVPVREYNRQK